MILVLFVLSPYTAVLSCFFSVFYLYKNKGNINKNTWNIGLLILFVWSFFVGIINKSSMSILVSLLFLLYFCMSVYIENEWSNEEKICEISHWLLKISIISGVIGIIEKIAFGIHPMLVWRFFLGLPATTSSTHRIYSTFGNPNIAGDWFAIMIIVALFYEGRTKEKNKKFFYYSCVALFLINLFFTGSRGAFAAMAGGLIVLFMFKCSKHNRMIFLGIILVIAVIGFMPDKVPNLSEGIIGHQINRSLSLRERIWKGSFEMFNEKPLTGWGLMGTIEHGKEFISYSGIVHHSHNIWLAILTSLGVVGLMVYLIMRLQIYKNIIQLLIKDSRSSIQLLIAIQVIIIIHGLVDFTIIVPQIGGVFIATSAMITALAKDVVSFNGNMSSYMSFELNNKL